jgi:hypothetical protein
MDVPEWRLSLALTHVRLAPALSAAAHRPHHTGITVAADTEGVTCTCLLRANPLGRRGQIDELWTTCGMVSDMLGMASYWPDSLAPGLYPARRTRPDERATPLHSWTWLISRDLRPIERRHI